MSFWEQIKTLVNSVFEPDQEPEKVELPLASAVLLLEIARSDMHVSEPEITVIKHLLVDYYALSEQKSDQVIALAKAHVEALISLRDFTKAINEAYTEQEKEHLIKAFWELAYADGVLDDHEEHWIGRLSELLYVPRSMVMKHKHFANPDSL